jgi:alanine-glyoxylate transaminase/serine-glyoxylate transaminase/serine-pyruvate transaminase
MSTFEPPASGRHFLQIPGPTNVPDRVLQALSRPTIDHRSAEFAHLTQSILERLGKVCNTSGPVLIYPSSGSGAWEAALVNTLSPGDRVLMCETGHFAILWRDIAVRLGLEVDWIAGDWRHGVDPETVEAQLAADRDHAIKAVAVVHNETSSGCATHIDQVRAAIDRVGHPALLVVDAISSLGSTAYDHDAWGVDVTVAGSQKGLMLPPGLAFNVVSEKALQAARIAKLPRSYWDWEPILQANKRGFFPYTPATNLLFGLDVALDMLFEEGLEKVYARHTRHAGATRRAVEAWGLETLCLDPAAHSHTLTAVLLPTGCDADEVRKLLLERFDLSLGTGLGKFQGKIFRIGHLGGFNDLMLAATLCGIEMGLRLAGVAHHSGGVEAALDALIQV